MAGLRRSEQISVVVVVVTTALAGIAHYAGWTAVLAFALAAIALAGLAHLVAVGTEQVGERFGPGVTGLMQSTLGNLPELFVVIFALRAGEIVVAQTSILGSLLANALLVLGLAIAAGAWRSKDGLMRFHPRLPNDTATLLLLVVFMIAVLGASTLLEDAASDNAATISAIGAVLILAVYGSWLVSYLRAGTHQEPALEHEGGAPLPFRAGLVVLALAGVAAAFVSDWFVAAIDPAVEALGISKAFTGLVIVAIAGNAVENVVGVQLAWKRQSDLAISVVKNSVAQIAAFLYPALVLISLAFENQLTFASPLVLTVALVFAALALWQITGDGEATLFEGFSLVSLYVILATVYWFE
jgi:Ca2+:H+ antiporter